MLLPNNRHLKGVVAILSLAGLLMLLILGSCKSDRNRNAKREAEQQQRASALELKARAECGEVCPSRILVKFVRPLDSIGLQNIQTLAEKRIGTPVIVKQVGGLNVVSISGSGVDTRRFLQESTFRDFDDQFGIEYVEPDFMLKLHSLPQDEFFKNQWGLMNNGQVLGLCGGAQPKHEPQGMKGADINVVNGWSKPVQTGDFVVAILDTGVDYDHPDISANIWSAPMAFDVVIGGQKVHCAAGSHGFNSITNQCDPKESRSSHGTNIAGIVGAATDDRVGTVGVNPQMSILVVKAFDGDSACVSQVANAIEFLTTVTRNPSLKADVRVINNSYGIAAETISDCKVHDTCQSKVLKESVSSILSNGILFVASAGNDRRDTDCIPEYPANFDFPNIIAVAASTNQDTLAEEFSNFGVTSTHLIAPGQDICAPGIGGYGYQEGTSMSAPFVAGSAALLLSRCGLSLGFADLKKKLIDNADTIDLKFKGKTVLGRRLNVERALLTCGS